MLDSIDGWCRLAGVSLVVPVINFWWPYFPPKLVKREFEKQLKRDQWKLRIAHYAPGFVLYWWMTQKFFPRDSISERHPILLNKRDLETMQQMSQVPMPNQHKIRQQGEYESLYRDMMVHFGDWEFDPMELQNPFPQNDEASYVYLWQGHEDKLVPFELQRFLARQLPWIRNKKHSLDLLSHQEQMKRFGHHLKLLFSDKKPSQSQAKQLCRGFCQGTKVVSPNQDDLVMISPRIKLRDGRHLAYLERGVSKDVAKYKIIIVHGFGSSKEMNFLAPQELIDELGIYLLQYDRAGYGESDPNPKRSLKSEALDIQELADQLELGPQFYVIGVSMGSYATWSCLQYLPHRLAGLALIAPVINYKWPSLPKSLIREDYRRKLVQWARWLASYCPRLLHWWVTQKWLPSAAVIEKNPAFFNKSDIDILKTLPGFPMLTKDSLREQVVFDTLRHDWRVAFGKWEFDPLKLMNPFPHSTSSSVHIWQGYEDKVVPSQLQRFVSGKLPWIHYHEVPDGGHLIVYYRGLCEAILRALLLGQEYIAYKPNKSALFALNGVEDKCSCSREEDPTCRDHLTLPLHTPKD
ncbi:hypothetical protein AHAS_Ahas08G0092800 [Arachis hypogaea]